MYDQIFKEISAIGIIVLSFGSGILFQKVFGLRVDLEKFQKNCELRHSCDKEIHEKLTIVATKIEDLFSFRSEDE